MAIEKLFTGEKLPSDCCTRGTSAGTPPFTIPHPIGKYKFFQSTSLPFFLGRSSDFNVLFTKVRTHGLDK